MTKKILFAACLCLQLFVKAQYCTSDNRFTQAPVFTDAQIAEDSLVYANAVNCLGASQALKLNVFYPADSVETLAKRPMILMIYGGAFIAGNRYQVSAYCMDFAKRGYVAVAIDYRLGKDTMLPCADTLSQEKAVYRAIQDAHASMRYMVANAATYKIDTAWLFIGGYSAGAGAANGLVYNSQAESNQVYPGIVAALGNLNNSGNALTNTFTLKGIFNNWGGASSDFFDAAEGLPTVSFHGGADGVVPVDSAIDITCFTTSHYIYGSHALYQKLTAVGICGDLTVKLNGGHGVYQGGGGLTMRVSRAACFFKSLFCKSCVNYQATDSVTPNCASIPAGLARVLIDKSPVIYPNPASGEIHIDATGQLPYDIEIVDLLDRVWLRASNPLRLDISPLPSGVYTLRVIHNDSFFSQKLVRMD